jgi:hypothetical protein
MRANRKVYKVLVGKTEGKRILQHLYVDGRIILKQMLKKWGGWVWTGSI